MPPNEVPSAMARRGWPIRAVTARSVSSPSLAAVSVTHPEREYDEPASA
jgi:hypothetical protein